MPTLVKGRRDWPAILSLGFNIDRNGKRRKPVWISIVTLGILLPGFAMWGLYRVFTTPTGIGLWVLAAALYLFTMFGVTLGNHRYWTHRGFEARFPLRVVLAVASGMSVEGDIQGWVLNHRATTASPTWPARIRTRLTNTRGGGGTRAWCGRRAYGCSSSTSGRQDTRCTGT